MTEPSYPGLIQFRCGAGISSSAEGAGPSVWMALAGSDRSQLGVTMQPSDALTIASALVDSALRATGPDGSLKLVGGVLEETLRRVLAEVVIATQYLPAEQALGLDQARRQLQWLLGGR